ncbi:tautomerase family protein [Dyella sp. LX-66]|uniref:tautomerase family protein n=1 Tax=unclassified Dyella TaxID=2634549 RepID=UPI001BDFBF0F|nr:tautomerase family protein [Dyella sp. LX-1]MBT2141481.1 tautomerase family protein [Dyella sp. LX-66]
MPHVIVKAWPGKTEAQKQELAQRITRDIVEVFDYTEDAVSVAFVEIQPAQWASEVYGPDIKANWNALYKKPGYSM